MIDFKSDGEFKAPEANHLTGHAIIGLGSAGVNILDQVVLDYRETVSLFGFDTDEQIIRGSVVGEKMLLGVRHIHGLGTGGDPSLAAEIVREERQEIVAMLQGVRTAILVAGFGGGTGSGMALEFTRLLKQLGATVVVVAVTPFAFEGKRRGGQALEALTALKKEADAVLCLSNERLLGMPGQDVDIRHGFATMNGLVGRTCLNLRAVLNQKGPMQIHLSDLKNLLAEHDCGDMTLENCWTGFGMATGSEEVVDEVLSGPLFADGQAWSRGSAVIASLSGGRNLSMGEFQTMVEYLKREMPVELPILAGTILEPYESETLSLTLMVIGQNFDNEEEAPKAKAREEFVFSPVAEEPKTGTGSKDEETLPTVNDDELFKIEADAKPRTEQKYFVQQEELPLDKKIYRGRFEKSSPTIFNGEDLDQPTFMRRNIKVRL